MLPVHLLTQLWPSNERGKERGKEREKLRGRERNKENGLSWRTDISQKSGREREREREREARQGIRIQS